MDPNLGRRHFTNFPFLILQEVVLDRGRRQVRDHVESVPKFGRELCARIVHAYRRWHRNDSLVGQRFS